MISMPRFFRVHLAAGVAMFSQSIVLLALSPALFEKSHSASLASIAFATVWLPSLCLIPFSQRIMTRFRLRDIFGVSEFVSAVILIFAALCIDYSMVLALILLLVRGFFSSLSYAAGTLYIKGVADPAAVRREISAFEGSRLVGSMLSAMAGMVVLIELDFRAIGLIAAGIGFTGAAIGWTWHSGLVVASPYSSALGQIPQFFKRLSPSVSMLLLLLSTMPLLAYHHVARTPLAIDYLHLGVQGVATVVLVNTVSVAAGAWAASFAAAWLARCDRRIYVAFNTMSGLLLALTPFLKNPVVCLLAYGAYLFVFEVCFTAINSAMIADADPAEAAVLVPIRVGSVQAMLLVFVPFLGLIADQGGLGAAAAGAVLISVLISGSVVWKSSSRAMKYE